MCNAWGILVIRLMPTKNTKENVLKVFKKQHGNKYDYSLVNYVNSNTKVIVICYNHGPFEITPQHHKNGVGCRLCYDDRQRISKEVFEKRARKCWGEIYDYSRFDELPATGQKVEIFCKQHQIFYLQEPRNHIRGHTGCSYCKSLKLSGNRENIGNIRSPEELTDEFKKRAIEVHGNLYDYSNYIYKSVSIKGEIVCKLHGSFLQSPGNHLRGNKCPECVKESLSKKTFKEKCIQNNVNYHRALKRRQAGLSEEKIFAPEYIRSEREINKITVHGVDYPNMTAAVRALGPPATTTTIQRWINSGLSPEEAFERVPNPGYAEGIVYLITNLSNNKKYIGITIQTLERRWKYHQEQANAHYIKNDDSLHHAIREFGAENFSLKQIDSGTSKGDLEEKERKWIKELGTIIPDGYNISHGGVSGGANSRLTTIDGITFKSVKEAAIYLSETKGISEVAAKKRISKGTVHAKTRSKPGRSYVKTKLYKTWSSIVHGSVNPKSRDYIPNVTILEKWKDFLEFRKDVGEAPEKEMVFKRLDQSLGFTPENCKWVTRKEAARINADFIKKR